MSEPAESRPTTVPANLDALRRQLERLGCELGRHAANPKAMQRPSPEPPLFSAGK